METPCLIVEIMKKNGCVFCKDSLKPLRWCSGQLMIERNCTCRLHVAHGEPSCKLPIPMVEGYRWNPQGPVRPWCVHFPWRIHGAGIYANIKWHKGDILMGSIYSSTMDPMGLGLPLFVAFRMFPPHFFDTFGLHVFMSIRREGSVSGRCSVTFARESTTQPEPFVCWWHWKYGKIHIVVAAIKSGFLIVWPIWIVGQGQIT